MMKRVKVTKRLHLNGEPVHGIERDWIRVGDKLPEEGQTVIVTRPIVIFGYEQKYVEPAVKYLYGQFIVQRGYRWEDITDTVTHWMPYPTPAED